MFTHSPPAPGDPDPDPDPGLGFGFGPHPVAAVENHFVPLSDGVRIAIKVYKKICYAVENLFKKKKNYIWEI